MENVFFARQPILDVNNNTYGYELLYRNQPGVNAYTGNNERCIRRDDQIRRTQLKCCRYGRNPPDRRSD